MAAPSAPPNFFWRPQKMEIILLSLAVSLSILVILAILMKIQGDANEDARKSGGRRAIVKWLFGDPVTAIGIAIIVVLTLRELFGDWRM
jgi:hypothetical protein